MLGQHGNKCLNGLQRLMLARAEEQVHGKSGKEDKRELPCWENLCLDCLWDQRSTTRALLLEALATICERKLRQYRPQED